MAPTQRGNLRCTDPLTAGNTMTKTTCQGLRILRIQKQPEYPRQIQTLYQRL
jgi:hypothetical protein